MSKLNIACGALLMIFFTSSLVLASQVTLKSGQKIEGKIVEQTDKYVKIDSGIGTAITYYTDEIDSLDGQKIKQTKDLSENNTNAADAQTQELPKVTIEIPKNEQVGTLHGETNNYVITDEERNSFTKALTSLLNMSKIGDSNISNSLVSLNEFRTKYPASPLANDAYYVPLLIEFTGAVMQKDKDTAEKHMNSMQQFIQQHPDGATTELTRKIWRDSLGEKASGVLYISYDLITNFMNGLMASEFQDDNASVKYFTILKNQLNFDNERDRKSTRLNSSH